MNYGRKAHEGRCPKCGGWFVVDHETRPFLVVHGPQPRGCLGSRGRAAEVRPRATRP